jgi:protein-S-isoprenylcysteine O-methyltransferase Ste14
MAFSFIRDNVLVISVLLINLLASLSYFLIINNEKLMGGFHRMNVVFQKAYVFLFVAPLFVSPFLSQARFGLSPWIAFVAGGLLAAAGALMMFFSFFKIGFIPSIKSKSGLSVSGTYGIVRHPIYSGTILAFAGVILLMKAFISLCYLPLSILLYFLITVFEEKDLLKAYGDEYDSYRASVKYRILPFIL